MLEEACDFEVLEVPDDEVIIYLCALFQLDFFVTDRYLVVTGIEVYKKRNGIGRTIIETVHDYCREHWLTPVADNVNTTDEAEGFWMAMGYSPDPNGTRNYYHEDLFTYAA